MKKRRSITFLLILGLLAVGALALALAPTQARAQDTDLDGYLDSEELGEFITPEGMQYDYQVDVNKPDAFVIIVPDNPSLIPSSNWWDLMTKTHAEGGLDHNVNVINVSLGPDSDRRITDNQNAGRITEDTFNAVGQQLGWCQQGTLNDEDNCIVWTARIVNHIKSICGSRHPGPKCKAETEETGTALEELYITWAMLHELGHAMTCARCYLEEYGGNHTPVDTGWIMDQSVYAVDKGGKVTFHIPNMYSPESKAAADLSVEKDSSVCEAVRTGKGKKK